MVLRKLKVRRFIGIYQIIQLILFLMAFLIGKANKIYKFSSNLADSA